MASSVSSTLLLWLSTCSTLLQQTWTNSEILPVKTHFSPNSRRKNRLEPQNASLYPSCSVTYRHFHSNPSGWPKWCWGHNPGSSRGTGSAPLEGGVSHLDPPARVPGSLPPPASSGSVFLDAEDHAVISSFLLEASRVHVQKCSPLVQTDTPTEICRCMCTGMCMLFTHVGKNRLVNPLVNPM